ncbi:MAG: ketoacyl-ACP synthase III [Ruminiclostridium sp.]|nr:ketoacyl-ACP synthase III [Ruminiclostridium sp.]
MRGIKIIGAGMYVPEKEADNDWFSTILDTNDEWIYSRTGIRARRISVDKPNFYMAGEAAKAAVADSGIDPAEIDLVLAATCSPDFYYPALSCLVQHETGAVNAAAFDINSACTGFINALDTASRFLEDSDYRNILVVASERLAPHCDYTDRTASILFGDGAGAAVVTRSDKPMWSYLSAKGDYFNALYCKIDHSRSNCPLIAGKDALPEGIIDTEAKSHFLQMNGKAVYKFAVEAMETAVNKVLAKAGLGIDDIDLYIPHQANSRIIESAVKGLGLPVDKVYVNLERRGNTSSACIPTCLAELKQAGRIKDGMTICLVGFGAGLTSGAVVFNQ